MRSSIFCGLEVGGVLAGGALAAERGQPVEPGGKIGAMTVVCGDDYNANENMFVACPTLISKPGTYHRSCSPPKVPRLYIGAGDFAPTQKEIDHYWKYELWSLWVDGRPVDRPRFGTSESHAWFKGKPVVWKQTRVALTAGQLRASRHPEHAVVCGYERRQPRTLTEPREASSPLC